MREKGSFSIASYTSRAKEVERRGTATYEAKDRVNQGKGMDPLVDPRGLPKYGPMRGAGNLLVPVGDKFELKFGVAMPSETDCDLTGSMGANVDIFFKVQKNLQKLLNDPKTGVLRRYQVQMCTGAIQDQRDLYPYQRSQFEPDNEVERQMGLLYDQRDGQDTTEDYQLSAFAAAYLTDASITKYGLRGYYYMVGDADSRTTLDRNLVKRVFGEKALEVAFGGQVPQRLPDLAAMMKVIGTKWHHFFLNVNGSRYNRDFWAQYFGDDRIIDLRPTEDLAEVQAVIAGLTEGVFDIEGAVTFLKEVGDIDGGDARRIVDSCGQIPIGLQKTFPNFDKIPMAGALFASRDDIWPIGTTGVSSPSKPAKTKKPATKKDDKKEDWKL